MLIEKMVELKQRLIEYANLVEDMIEKSVRGLLEKSPTLFDEVINDQEPKANNFDLEIDELCTEIIAVFEPVARDLRTVLMIIKMNKDLERMADHAVNISESGQYLLKHPLLKSLDDLKIMAHTSTAMLKDSINSFVNQDVAAARAVCDRDNIVDDLGDKILKELTGYMRGENDGIKRSLHVMRIAHNLERVADLSTNICEEVIYIVEGKDIKHHKDEV